MFYSAVRRAWGSYIPFPCEVSLAYLCWLFWN